MVTVIRAAARVYVDAFRGLPGDVWRLSFGLFLTRAGTMVLPFLSLYLVRELGHDAGAAAFVLFAFGMGSVAGSYVGGELSGRWGTLGVQVISLILAGLAFLAVPQLRAFAAVTLAVFVASALNDIYRPACMAAVVEVAPAPVLARAMGLMRLAANAGIAVGPAVGGLLAVIDYRWIFVGDAVTCWLAATWLFLTMRGKNVLPSEERRAAKTAGPSPWTDGPFMALLGLVLVASLVIFQAFSTLPLYLVADYGFDERMVGLVFAFSTGLIVIFEMILIKSLEHRDPSQDPRFRILPLVRRLRSAALRPWARLRRPGGGHLDPGRDAMPAVLEHPGRSTRRRRPHRTGDGHVLDGLLRRHRDRADHRPAGARALRRRGSVDRRRSDRHPAVGRHGGAGAENAFFRR